MKQDRSIVIHTRLLTDESLKKMESALNTANPNAFSLFCENVIRNREVNTKELSILSERLKEERKLISEDDRKLIQFFSKANIESTFFLDICGNAIYLTEVISELNKLENNNYENVKSAVLMWLYVNMYELICKTMTNGIEMYIKNKKEYKEMKEKIERKKKNGEHLQAGEIADFFISLHVLNKDNNSIFGKRRILRNKISHSNIFYDAPTQKFVLSNGKTYEKSEFENEFKKMYEFLLEWLYVSNDKNPDVLKTIKRMIWNISKELRKIGRSGLLRKEYSNIIISWEEESSKNSEE